MSNIDWSQLITKKMKDDELAEHANSLHVTAELQWQTSEMAVIADQLLAVEDGDPAALPGTEREWRDYRIQVRAWKEGAEGYPYSGHRPARPS